jgi:hypothetical protein
MQKNEGVSYLWHMQFLLILKTNNSNLILQTLIQLVCINRWEETNAMLTCYMSLP